MAVDISSNTVEKEPKKEIKRPYNQRGNDRSRRNWKPATFLRHGTKVMRTYHQPRSQKVAEQSSVVGWDGTSTWFKLNPLGMGGMPGVGWLGIQNFETLHVSYMFCVH